MKTVERLTELLNSKITWCNEKEKYCKFHLEGELCLGEECEMKEEVVEDESLR